ncbi:MAG TPA: hypothetical protein VG099_04610 [Gemmataceae bacterium]|jgi:predicted Zn finger-like uncharacterized protein|nr:hypothetical protein [Gemmataceae bacterium]
MPEVILNCPQCQRQLRVTEELLGRPVKCPACGLIFTVPMGGTEAQLAPVPVASEAPPAPRPEEGKRDPYEYPYDEHRRRLERGEPWDYDRDETERARGLLMPPAVCLLITGILGILINLGQAGYALVPKPPPPAHEGPPKDFMEAVQRGIEESQSGPVPLIGGLIFAGVSFLAMLGGIFMLTRRFYGMAILGSIMAMIDIGNCCCLLGLPFGIWALVVLARPEVKRLFQ